MDLASLELPTLTYRFVLASTRNPKRRPVAGKDLTSLPLGKPWNLNDQLAESQMVLAQFHQDPKKPVDGRVYLADTMGYHEAELTSVVHPACFGAEGTFHAPGLWAFLPGENNARLAHCPLPVKGKDGRE